MPPLLYLLLLIVSFGMGVAYEADEAGARAGKFVHQQVSQLIGNDAAAKEIGQIIQKTQRQSDTWLKSIVSFVGVLLGASAVMLALQASLNQVWGVMPDPEKSGIKYFFAKRLLSLSMILAIGFLLLVSLLASSVLALLSLRIGSRVGIEGLMAELVNQVVAFCLITTMFAVLMRYMPDAIISWKDVWVGALMTAILFTLGRIVIQFYLSTSGPTAQPGYAAASMAVILVWVYYSSMIFLLGAEFTRSWAEFRGRIVRSEPYAVKVVETIERS